MPREAEPSLNERTFVTQALHEGHRLDGRALDQFRKLDLSFGEQYGVADVTLGKTRYIWTLPSNACFSMEGKSPLVLTHSPLCRTES